MLGASDSTRFGLGQSEWRREGGGTTSSRGDFRVPKCLRKYRGSVGGAIASGACLPRLHGAAFCCWLANLGFDFFQILGNVRSYFSLTVPVWENEFPVHRFINCYSISAVFKQAVLEVAFTIFRERDRTLNMLNFMKYRKDFSKSAEN